MTTLFLSYWNTFFRFVSRLGADQPRVVSTAHISCYHAGVRTVVPPQVFSLVLLVACTGVPVQQNEPLRETSAPPVVKILHTSSSFASSAPRTWTLVAIGDVMLSRTLPRAAARSGDPLFPFASLGPVLRSADLAFANLENPVVVGPPAPLDGLVFRMDPSYVPRLTQAGIDVVSLANNHLTDAGLAGVAETRQHLTAAGVAVAGAGETVAQARLPALMRAGDVTVAVLAYADPRFANQVRFATEDQPGVALAEAEAMAADVAAARQLADVIIVSLHAGAEEVAVPDARHQALLEAVAAAKPDLVLGHHPHVLQPFTYMNGVPVFASLGNAVFDQIGTDVNRSAAVRIRFQGTKIMQIDVLPFRIEGGAPVLDGSLQAYARQRFGLAQTGAILLEGSPEH
jgi:poly-gamma-glutamate capsule biosynthesis protein CapA/YwtB (metallophosphatase superfamily)